MGWRSGDWVGARRRCKHLLQPGGSGLGEGGEHTVGALVMPRAAQHIGACVVDQQHLG